MIILSTKTANKRQPIALPFLNAMQTAINVQSRTADNLYPAPVAMRRTRFLKSIWLLRALMTAAIILLNLQTRAQTPLPGLIGQWKGEGNATDSFGTNNGYVSPSLFYIPGHSGQAFDLWEGIISAPDAANLKPTNVTVQAWVKGVAPGTFRYLVNKARATSGQSYALYTGAANVGAAFFVNFAGGGTVASPSTGTNIWDGNWHQLTGTFDGSVARIFVDGTEAGAGTTTTNTSGIDYSSPGPLILGDLVVSRSLPFVGSLDEVKIFDHALNAGDIASTFSDPSSAAATNGLITWYKAEGNTLDSWGSNHGTVSPPRAFAFAPGRVGQAFYPQGAGAVWIPDAPELQPTNLSIQVWAKSVSPATFRYLVSKWRGAHGGGTFNNSYALYTGSSAGAAFFVNLQTTGNDITVISPQAPNAAVWDGAYHLLTGTWDGSVSRMYVDGFEVGAGTTNTNPNVIGIDYSIPRQLFFGNYQGPPGLPFTGMEDEIQIYNRALTPPEILAYFAGTNLVSWWNANSSANDSIGGDNGYLSGSAGYTAARTSIGKAFSTIGGSVTVPDSASLHFTNLTLQAEVSGTTPGTNKYIISKSYTGSSASYAFYTGPNGGLQFYITLNGVGRVASPDAGTTIWDGRFHLVDGTYDGQTVRLYVDGKEMGTGTSASGQIQYGTTYNAGQLLFGDFATTTSSSNFTGLIDEVKLYSTALSAQQVDANSFKPFLVVTPPQSQTVAQGTNLNLAINVQGPAPINYQWQLNGTNITGATNSTLVVSNIQPAQSGQYRVQLTGGGAQYTNSTVSPGGKGVRSGISGLIDIGNTAAFETDNFTVQAYARAINPGTFKYIFSKSRHPTSFSASYGLYTGSTGGAIFFVVLQGPLLALVPIDAGTNYWDGNWHQFTGTWDGEFVSLYVDGNLINTVDSFGGNIAYSHDFLNGDLLLGDVLSPNSQFHFPGDYDEVKYFDHALSGSDVMDSYTNPNSVAATNGLVSWYKLDNTTLDSWGANNGAVVPAPVFLVSDSASITVTASAPPVITSIGVASGNFHATVTGPTGQTFVIQESPNLSSWTAIYTNIVPFTFTTSVGSGNAGRFYRAVSQ
jgi:Concanavalin A-like lectin/glucanases superfamily/Immunoglobulin domain